MTEIPKQWQDRSDQRRAPRGHIYLARGPYVWAVGITRGDAITKARGLAETKHRSRIYAQCLPDDVIVSEIDGYASWGDHPKDCSHCERCYHGWEQDKPVDTEQAKQ